MSQTIPRRTVHEWVFTTSHEYREPFTDVTVRVTCTSPSGVVATIEAFYDGEQSWKARFNPGETGTWTWRSASVPPNPELTQEGEFSVTPRDAAGFLVSTPGEAWGFARESGEPVFIFGDTVYHLFGMAHNSPDGFDEVRRFMQRRREQGVNLLRIRIPVSPFHPVDGYSVWQTQSLWPWRGSPQAPRFDQFNLAYFRTVDAVVALAEELDIGIEMIMQAWGFEFPFNARNIFVAEWEELWVRYLVARYDAYNAVWMWQLQNEYEYYPNGDWNYSQSGVADRWAIRMAHLVRRLGPHGHVIAIHNGPRLPSFGRRFAADPTAIDTVTFQSWGTTSEERGWLAAGIEEEIDAALGDWPGSAVLAEWGYEFNPDLPPMMLGHRWCDEHHTRRGAWRGAMRGLGIVHGFENSWGPFQVLDSDQPGLAHLQHLHRFFTGVVDFASLRPAPVPASELTDPGTRPLALASPDGAVRVIYLPVGGQVSLPDAGAGLRGSWFDPRTGATQDATSSAAGTWAAPAPADPARPDDWVLVLRAG